MDKIAQIDQWYMRQFARFLEKLEATKDVDGTSVLSNSMIVYGSGNSDGNHHTHSNLPIILAGRWRGRNLDRALCQVQVQAHEQPLPEHAGPAGSRRGGSASAIPPGGSRGSRPGRTLETSRSLEVLMPRADRTSGVTSNSMQIPGRMSCGQSPHGREPTGPRRRRLRGNWVRANDRTAAVAVSCRAFRSSGRRIGMGQGSQRPLLLGESQLLSTTAWPPNVATHRRPSDRRRLWARQTTICRRLSWPISFAWMMSTC